MDILGRIVEWFEDRAMDLGAWMTRVRIRWFPRRAPKPPAGAESTTDRSA
jgi:hypothetical protein